MNEQARPVASLNTRPYFVCSVLLALACILVPVGTAYAQDASGSVVCEQVSDWTIGDITLHTLETVSYPVDMYLAGNTVIGRWGSGLDMQYHGAFGVMQTSKKATTYMVYFYSMSDPDNPATFEDLYSETGLWTIRVGKDNSMTITGKSFSVVDTTGFTVAGECNWTLKGTFPVTLSKTFPK